MINFILKLLGTAGALIVISYLVPGITVSSFGAALIAGIVFAVINITIKPILTILAFPINIITLGFFGFIINVFCFWLVSYFVAGFSIATINAAIIGAFAMAVLMWFVHIIVE